jgi:histidinol phosphatase-like PHP family hydrolase
MAAAAIARGYAYYAICDHAQRLRGDLLQRQADAIDALNELVAPFRILKGIEVNVRADGSLDVSDEDLATRDWVVASVHSRFDDHVTERALRRWRARTSTASGTSPTAASASARRRRSTSSA